MRCDIGQIDYAVCMQSEGENAEESMEWQFKGKAIFHSTSSMDTNSECGELLCCQLAGTVFQVPFIMLPTCNLFAFL